ncbi:hypothetical protein RDWZM_010534 [Blomia tropicalis]|uniref:Uncharacterized protein n=1 Tax=Blomia tropicalis TaxID=40697 RepID=A0A9Q0LZA0_BLOTA|nr:hypothetical protein RDWZM_010534 [Blomia tropicalis]
MNVPYGPRASHDNQMFATAQQPHFDYYPQLPMHRHSERPPLLQVNISHPSMTTIASTPPISYANWQHSTLVQSQPLPPSLFQPEVSTYYTQPHLRPKFSQNHSKPERMPVPVPKPITIDSPSNVQTHSAPDLPTSSTSRTRSRSRSPSVPKPNIDSEQLRSRPLPLWMKEAVEKRLKQAQSNTNVNTNVNNHNKSDDGDDSSNHENDSNSSNNSEPEISQAKLDPRVATELLTKLLLEVTNNQIRQICVDRLNSAKSELNPFSTMKKGNHKNEKKRKVSTDSSIHIDNDKHVTGNTKNDCVKGKDDQSGKDSDKQLKQAQPTTTVSIYSESSSTKVRSHHSESDNRKRKYHHHSNDRRDRHYRSSSRDRHHRSSSGDRRGNHRSLSGNDKYVRVDNKTESNKINDNHHHHSRRY